MTQEQEQTPPPGAGRELDKIIAEKMGREVKTIATNSSGQPIYRMSIEHGDWKSWTGIPAYSTSIAAAWELVEKYKFAIFPPDEGNPKWTVAKWDDTSNPAEADTAPHAIVLAFLALPDFEVKQ